MSQHDLTEIKKRGGMRDREREGNNERKREKERE
jgi:hypothetical protein